MSSHEDRPMPSMRGVFHVYGFYAFLIAGVALVALAKDTEVRWVAAGYVSSIIALFGISAIYHRYPWSDKIRPWIRRLDHSMIFVSIAGSLSPFVFSLGGEKAVWVTQVIWLGVACGVLAKIFWIDAPDWVSSTMYVAVAWVSVFVFPDMVDVLGWYAVTLIMLGGVFYSVGAVVYALNRPDPWPNVFGYHEIFHILVLMGAGTHFGAVAYFVVM